MPPFRRRKRKLVEDLSRRGIVKKFLGSNTIGGLPQSFETYYYVFKIGWLFCVFAGLIATGIHLTVIFKKHFDYKVSVKMSIKSNDSMDFPAVTVCNLNPVKVNLVACGKYYQLHDIQEKVKDEILSKTSIQNLYRIYFTMEVLAGNTNILGLLDWYKDLIGLTKYDNLPYCGDTTTQEANDPPTTPSANYSYDYYDDYYSNSYDYYSTTEPPMSNDDYLEMANLTTQEDLYNLIYNSKFDDLYSNEWSDTAGPINSENLDLYHELKDASMLKFADFIYKSKLSDLEDIKDLFTFMPDMTELGTQAKKFIKECTMDRTNCLSLDSFLQTTDPKYGNCYTFNSALEEKEAIHTSKSGNSYGLRMTLDIESNEYIGLLAHEYGVKVTIHDPKTKATPDSEGFIASPGRANEVGVRLRKVTRMPPPFESECLKFFPDNYMDFSENRARYTVTSCKSACMDSIFYGNCSCVLQQHKTNTKYRICDIANEKDRNCTAELRGKFSKQNNKFCSDCKPGCTDFIYQTSLSHGVWPTEAYQQLKMANFYEQHLVASEMVHYSAFDSWKSFIDTNYISYEEYISKSLVRLHVYFQSFSFELIEEEEAYTKSSLVSDIGGVAGLYLGMSIVTALEVIQLILMLLFGARDKKGEVQKIVPPVSKEQGGPYIVGPPWEPPAVKYTSQAYGYER